MGVWSDATDGWDADWDEQLGMSGSWGYAGVYHEEGVGGWEGPTGYWKVDARATLAPDESKTWTGIYVWADPMYEGHDMYFSMQPHDELPPVANRTYELELVAIPEGVTGAPSVGTIWTLSLYDLMTLTLPTYTSVDGLTGYEFAFTISAEFDPCAGTPPADANCDGAVDFFDIDPFVIAVVDGELAWMDYFGGTPPCDFLCVNDLDGSGTVDFFDIDPFVVCVTEGCP